MTKCTGAPVCVWIIFRAHHLFYPTNDWYIKLCIMKLGSSYWEALHLHPKPRSNHLPWRNHQLHPCHAPSQEQLHCWVEQKECRTWVPSSCCCFVERLLRSLVACPYHHCSSHDLVARCSFVPFAGSDVLSCECHWYSHSLFLKTCCVPPPPALPG